MAVSRSWIGPLPAFFERDALSLPSDPDRKGPFTWTYPLRVDSLVRLPAGTLFHTTAEPGDREIPWLTSTAKRQSPAQRPGLLEASALRPSRQFPPTDYSAARAAIEDHLAHLETPVEIPKP